MRRTFITAFALILALVLAAPATRAQNSSSQETAPAAVPPPVQLHYEVEFGGETRITTDGDRWTKFLQFKDVPNNFTVNYLHFTIGKEGSPWSLEGWGRDATQLDQRYRLVLEKFGRMRTEFRYDGFPNFISRLTVAPYNQVSPGVFTVSNTFQAALQAAPDANVPPLVTDLVVNTPFGDLHPRRQRYRLATDVTLTNHWRLDFGFLRDRRTGRKPIGLGSYERVGTPTGGFFRVLGDELPEPLDYRTTGFRAAVSYENRRGFLRLEYFGSWFENRIDALRWDNPFSLTDQEASLPSGGANRWRFGTGQLDLYPDNSAHTIAVSGRVNLPAQSFLSALAAWNFRRQNDPFLPWTLNTAVVTGVPVALFPRTPAHCRAPASMAKSTSSTPTSSSARENGSRSSSLGVIASTTMPTRHPSSHYPGT